MRNIEISVVIPSYKPQDYIFACLNSLTSQDLDYNKYEIIIILNGCREPWLSELKEYIDQNMSINNVSLIQTNKSGVSHARNIGLDNAKGTYITFIDDDDYVSNQYLSELLKVANSDTVALSNAEGFFDNPNNIHHNYHMKRAYDKLSKLKNPSLTQARMLFNGPYMKLIHKSIINNLRYDENFSNGEDSLFMFNISQNIKHIKISSPTAIYYRRYRNNSAVTRKRTRFQVIRHAFKKSSGFFKIWIKNPIRYNFIFFITRLLAPIRSIYSEINLIKRYEKNK